MHIVVVQSEDWCLLRAGWLRFVLALLCSFNSRDSLGKPILSSALLELVGPDGRNYYACRFDRLLGKSTADDTSRSHQLRGAWNGAQAFGGACLCRKHICLDELAGHLGLV